MHRWPRVLITTPLLLALVVLTGCGSNVAATGDGDGIGGVGGIDATSEVASSPATSLPSSITPTEAVTPVASTGASVVATPAATTAAFVSLNLTLDRSCAPQAGVTTAQAILRWQVSNATGIAVNINNASPYGATQYAMVSGAISVTTVSCTAGSYTFDVWTVGGVGEQAHRRLTYTPSN
jgi:hypothetical protein